MFSSPSIPSTVMSDYLISHCTHCIYCIYNMYINLLYILMWCQNVIV